MGIQGLLPLLKSIHKPTHLREFAEQTLGVDAYGWLHRGTVACAIDLAQGKPTRKHIDFVLNRVRMLIHFGVKPYLVFDGDYLPSKSHTEKDRAARRKESKRLGLEMLRMGRLSQAQMELQKAVDVTPVMARELIEELKQMDVKYVVAPYEADSQLAYLEKQGLISAVLSEDSDLLVFGVKCLVTKLDQYGECVMINREHFTACKDISLVGWSDKEFRLMAMLSGCDYLPGIGGMGLKTAYRLVRKYKVVDRIVRTVQFDGKMKVPSGYLEAFRNAERTFLYQWVFCPESGCLRNLVKLPDDLKAGQMPFIGKHVDADIAAGVACGDLDPNTKKPILLQRRFEHPARHNVTTQTPDEKHSKPISEFFRRIPLAELDPNSFTPSPSQQRLLESQRNTSWSASNVSGSYAGPSARPNRSQAPFSAPQVNRRTTSDSSLGRRRTSPKRQRLCSDACSTADTLRDTEDSHLSVSKFFGDQKADPSPSIRKTTRLSKDNDFELWSDDSIAEAVATVAANLESTQTPAIASVRKRKKIEVFNDQLQENDNSAEGDTSQATIDSRASTASQSLRDYDTPRTSLGSFASTPQSIFSKGIRTSFSALSAQNSFSLSRAASFSLEDLLPGDESSRHTSETVLSDQRAIQESPSKTRQEVMVPNSSPSDRDPTLDHTYEQKVDASASDAESERLDEFAVETTSCIFPKGSEDLLVPNSPEGAEDDDGRRRPKLHLSKFAFAG